ncbi:hypothetical protein CONCODRAFT_84797 [Conidiobolus coronatus NRRL 28638]|uniref:Ubiquitin-like domain-containing protein n=1 Tax=Conidiobolus coronatus (strain ATCC 28846 / CBS 209.66 / NRRL 28638) TaxID=796925 RepID=A0A137P8C2_CONC2|nr:hypothetical protein CONCODRAFT_84797 [Conidiobolus coronatus NRRL 28638]|eukprot:KXN71250.1 hypothetical protein CONCODRAFT_84797 [Conidiobolus coronatus NRRL 28638]
MSNVNTIVTIKFRREKKIIFLQAKFNEKFSEIKQRLLNYLDDVDNVDNIRLYNPQRELITDSLIVGFYNIKDYENLYLTLFNQETNSWEEINVPPFEDLRPLLPTDSSQMNERSMISPPNELGDNMDTDSDSDMDK